MMTPSHVPYTIDSATAIRLELWNSLIQKSNQASLYTQETYDVSPYFLTNWLNQL